jgi:hypothetical protein
MPHTLADEITRAKQLARDLITEYVDWRDKIRYGQEQPFEYMEALDFINFRVETADSCLLLLENQLVADALGLCRALLENHLLFMLMCRGTKFFQLEDTGLKGAAFRARLKEKQAELKALQDEGKTRYLRIEEYPRRSGYLMYVLEGSTVLTLTCRTTASPPTTSTSASSTPKPCGSRTRTISSTTSHRCR